MEWIAAVTEQAAGHSLEAGALFIGKDLLICLQGGERPHIGCTVQAVPHPSIDGSDGVHASSSVLNLPGHRDEVPCRKLAERLCRAFGTVVVCMGGIHIDGITAEQIAEILEAADRLGDRLERRIREYCSQAGIKN